MSDYGFKIVDFATYCKKCKHLDKKEDETPCDECLKISARIGSKKPERWVEK